MCYTEASKEEKIAIESWFSDLKNEFGIEANRELFNKIFPLCKRINLEFGYVVYMIADNMISKKECNIISFSLKKDKRTLKNIRTLLALVEKDAKESGCDHISIGSDFGDTERNNKLFRMLGYNKTRSLKKELK